MTLREAVSRGGFVIHNRLSPPFKPGLLELNYLALQVCLRCMVCHPATTGILLG